jgi:hypothetical protein
MLDRLRRDEVSRAYAFGQPVMREGVGEEILYRDCSISPMWKGLRRLGCSRRLPWCRGLMEKNERPSNRTRGVLACCFRRKLGRHNAAHSHACSTSLPLPSSSAGQDQSLDTAQQPTVVLAPACHRGRNEVMIDEAEQSCKSSKLRGTADRSSGSIKKPRHSIGMVWRRAGGLSRKDAVREYKCKIAGLAMGQAWTCCSDLRSRPSNNFRSGQLMHLTRLHS